VRDLEIRTVRDCELTVVAGLRWQWVLENGDSPTATRAEFVEDFAGWARENATTHRCFVAARGDAVVGMAWLATVRRVPTPRALDRRSGDVQCVYVVPGERDTGVGGRLIEALLSVARELGLERVTVHSSVRAVTAYARHGFAMSPRLLQADVG
jgi:GNAT superfamily N-acetyltransferase